MPNLSAVALAYADENLDRDFSAYNSIFEVYSDVTAKAINFRAEKVQYGVQFSYFTMNQKRQSQTMNLIISNPIGDVSSGEVVATSHIKSSGYRVAFHYVVNPKKLISYGPIVGVAYWSKEDILKTRIRYEEDDGTLLTQVGSEVVTEENRVDVKKESGFSPYGGGFLRFNVKRFQIGLNFQFYTQSDFSYQTSTLELGYQF
ncbi:hypothetical protein ACU6U9_10495 [Pseudomonas sp. HK3]